MANASGREDKGAERVKVGILTDPVAMPVLIGQQLAQDLPDLLSEQVDSARSWRMDLRQDRLPPSDSRHTAIIELAETAMRERHWDLVVCITDLPIRSGRHPIMGDMNIPKRVIVVSLPAFGVMALRRRVRAVVAELIADMHEPKTSARETGQRERMRIPTLGPRIRRHTPDQPGVDVRISSRGGDLRLLLGMVRANRPWSVVWGLTGPLVGAFAFSAFYLLNATIWDLATSISLWRLGLAAVGSLSVMTGWLIIYHNLWEPVKERPVGEREQAWLFNASTVLTLGLGVAFMYVALFLVNITAGAVLLSPDILNTYITAEVSWSAYVLIPVLVTAAATVAGAIGSGFESEESVRNAAFSLRERERREAFREKNERRQRAQQGAEEDVRG